MLTFSVPLFLYNLCHQVGYTTDDLQFMWQTGDPVQMDEIALPQFDIRQEDIDYGNCTKYYAGTGTVLVVMSKTQVTDMESEIFVCIGLGIPILIRNYSLDRK